MEKVLIADGDKCTGCQVCELICSMVRSGEYNPKDSLIKIMKNRELGVNIPVLSVRCTYCGKCAEWCFPQAIRFVSLEEGAIMRKSAKIGCFPAPMIG